MRMSLSKIIMHFFEIAGRSYIKENFLFPPFFVLCIPTSSKCEITFFSFFEDGTAGLTCLDLRSYIPSVKRMSMSITDQSSFTSIGCVIT